MKISTLLGAALGLTQPTWATPTSATTKEKVSPRASAASVEATYLVDASLPKHTLYRPTSPTAFAKLPILVWGNGGCSANSLSHRNFLLEVASWGVLVIASGTPNGAGSTSNQLMADAINWAGNYSGSTHGTLDASRVAAAGMSCGGLEAYAQVGDKRVTAVGIFNSGLFGNDTQKIVPGIKIPIFYFLGGPSDIAYANGERDYAALTPGTPSWSGNLPVGHGGTYSQAKGGKFATAAQHYFRWVLRGEAEAAEYFTGSGAKSDGWDVKSKSLDLIKVTPI